MNDIERDLKAHVDGLTPLVPPPFEDVTARRARRRTRRRAAIAMVGSAAAIVALVGGASLLRPDGSAEEPPVTAPETSPTRAGGISDVAPEWDEEGAPPIVLQLDGREVPVEPWTACYGNMCSDGFPQPPFADVGDRDEVPFSFPHEGWTFEASFSPSGEGSCERSVTVPVEKTGDYTFAVPPAGPPGAYDVDVFGRGPEGDVITTFAWTTTQRGFLPEPSGYLALVSDDDGDFIAYSAELGLADLATTPKNASLTVTVTAADGASRTIGPLEAEKGCSGDGQVFFSQDREGEAEPFDLGPAPFSYRAEVTLDGTAYVGTAMWPRDEQRDQAPNTTLRFDPPLPAYRG